MNVGIFDLLEHDGGPLAELYERRLQLTELYDRSGFYGYHVAEHHSTPHGLVASPSVYLAAVAQRTERLRFGPMVYLLPFYHPLRLIEEICMLDHLSRGRLDVGIGRGISPIERGLYGIDPSEAEARNEEVYAIMRAGLVTHKLDYEGRFYRLHDVPMELRPYQQPHPPFWYGTSSLSSIEWAAREGLNLVTSQANAESRTFAERYWAVRADSAPVAGTPLVGLARKVVVAPTDERAHEIAVRSYPQWLEYFNYHFTRLGQVRTSAERPPTWDEFVQGGRGVAGSPQTVANELRDHVAGSQFNYLIVEFSFGAITHAEARQSIELFAREVLPALAELPAGIPALAEARRTTA